MASIKNLSKYSEDALALAITSSLSSEEIQQFTISLTKVEETLKGTTRQKKEKKASPDVLSDKFIFENEIVPKILAKITAIEQQEHSGKYIELNISFDFNTHFENMKREELIRTHDKLLVLEETAIGINLLIQFQRGKLYSALKTNIKKSGQVFQTYIENELHLCYRTVLKYILVAGIISKFPRLVLCGLNFSQILKYKNKLLDYFTQEGKTLADRLSVSVDIIMQGKPMSIHHCDVHIPKISMPVSNDFEFRDKYEKSNLHEDEISKLADATTEQYLSSPDELDELERYVNKL